MPHLVCLRDEPSRRLGNEEEATELQSGEKGLEENGKSPAPATAHVQRSNRDNSRKNGAPEPDGLEEVRNICAMSRVGNFSCERWSGGLSKTKTNSEHDLGAEECPRSFGGCLNDGCCNHNG